MVSSLDLLTLILPIATFGIGMWYQENRNKKNNMREKARSIDEKTISMLKNKMDELSVHFAEKTFIKYEDQQAKPIIKFEPNYFIAAVENSDIFKVKNKEIILIYIKDKVLRKHMSNILSCLNYYHTCACKLEKLVNSLYSSKPPISFIEGVKEMCSKESSRGSPSNIGLNEKDFFALYFVSLTGSQNAYKNGTSTVIDLLTKRFDDLQSLAFNTLENKNNAVEIKTEINYIESTLNSAYHELQELHERWQNKYIF